MSPGLNDFTGIFYQTFRKEITPIFSNLFEKTSGGGQASNLIIEASIILITKSDKGIT